jgi:glycerol kinase
MKEYILALDQGTTSCRAILFDKNGAIQAVEQQEFTQFYPQPGWVEHNALEIWKTQLAVTQELLRKRNLSGQSARDDGGLE